MNSMTDQPEQSAAEQQPSPMKVALQNAVNEFTAMHEGRLRATGQCDIGLTFVLSQVFNQHIQLLTDMLITKGVFTEEELLGALSKKFQEATAAMKEQLKNAPKIQVGAAVHQAMGNGRPPNGKRR